MRFTNKALLRLRDPVIPRIIVNGKDYKYT